MPMFRPKTAHVEARQWTGSNLKEMREWMEYACALYLHDAKEIVIENRTGRVVAEAGDWIVLEDDGFYPVEPAMFALEYEAAT
jgi:hypothetical protein